MKVIIAGTRTFNNSFLLTKVVDYYSLKWGISEVVCGGADGADYAGKRWAINNGINVKMFPADWKNLGKSAGPIRNTYMAKYADKAIVFWDSMSRGAKNMIDNMDKENKECIICFYE